MSCASSWKVVEVVRPQPGQAMTIGAKLRMPMVCRISWPTITSRVWSPPGSGDPVLSVTTTGQAVRLTDRGSDGYPFALMLPSDWKLPTERTDMGLAYPDFVKFIASSGAQSADWYARPAGAFVRAWSLSDWAW